MLIACGWVRQGQVFGDVGRADGGRVEGLRAGGDTAGLVGDGLGEQLDGVRVWRLADGTPAGKPLVLHELVRDVAVHGDVIVTAAGADIAVHQLALPQPIR